MPPNTPNTNSQLGTAQSPETLYQKRLKPGIGYIINGTRTVVGDTLRGAVPIVGDVMYTGGRASGYLLGKAGLTIAASIHEVLNGVSGNEFGGKMFGEKTKAAKKNTP